LTIDFDGSVLSTKARRIEGTAVGYNSKHKGARSYYPLFATMAQTGQVYDVLHRPGNCHDSRSAKEFITSCIRNLRSSGFSGLLEARLDGAHFSDETCGLLADAGVEFSVSVPFERLPKLKQIVENRLAWQRIDENWSFFNRSWRPRAESKRVYRCVVYRQRVVVPKKGPIQLELFEPVHREYEYKVVMTNKAVGAQALLQFHNGRGSQEAIFAELKVVLTLHDVRVVVLSVDGRVHVEAERLSAVAERVQLAESLFQCLSVEGRRETEQQERGRGRASHGASWPEERSARYGAESCGECGPAQSARREPVRARGGRPRSLA
jgi:hypothetical protein